MIENYTQGNMDMATKMKELQRKFDQLVTSLNSSSGGRGGQQMYYNNYYGNVPNSAGLGLGLGLGGGGGSSMTNGIYPRSRSPASSVHSSYQETIHRPPPPPLLTPTPILPLFTPMSAPPATAPVSSTFPSSSSSSSNRMSFRTAANRFISPPQQSVICEGEVLGESSSSTSKVMNRISKMEIEIGSLNVKLDQLIRIATANAAPHSSPSHPQPPLPQQPPPPAPSSSQTTSE